MATVPKPIPGLVIRYSYLWASEYDAGAEEGRKDRPCAIIVAVEIDEGTTSVIVLPISHSPPNTVPALEIPRDTKHRLGLDDEQSWVILSEANEFIWPGFDLRPLKPGDAASVVYGELPASFFRRLRADFAKAYRERRTRFVSRTQ